MVYSNYNWITDQVAIGALVSEAGDDFPFDAVISMETHAPATVADLARSEDLEYRWFSIIDGYSWEPNAEIIRRFDDAAGQIDQWVRGQRQVLVHCTAGVSRSVTAVAWYLVRYRGYSWSDALELIRASRPQANPNPRFEIALRLAAGEDLSEAWMQEHIAAFCKRMEEDFGVDTDPAELWADLVRQGTVQRSEPVA